MSFKYMCEAASMWSCWRAMESIHIYQVYMKAPPNPLKELILKNLSTTWSMFKPLQDNSILQTRLSAYVKDATSLTGRRCNLRLPSSREMCVCLCYITVIMHMSYVSGMREPAPSALCACESALPSRHAHIQTFSLFTPYNFNIIWLILFNSLTGYKKLQSSIQQMCRKPI